MSDLTDALKLETKIVVRRISFLESYAAYQLNRQTEGRSAFRNFWSDKIPVAAAASAYLEALELQLLLAPDNSRSIRRHAKNAIAAFDQFGMGMAALLRALFLSQESIAPEVERYARQRRSQRSTEGPQFEQRRATELELASYSQQGLVWIAAITHPNSPLDAAGIADAELRRARKEVFGLPFGPMGQPLGLYADLALALKGEDRQPSRTFFTLRRKLALEQNRFVEDAQRNGYLWTNLLVHFPLVDFPMLSISIAALRRDRELLKLEQADGPDIVGTLASRLVNFR